MRVVSLLPAATEILCSLGRPPAGVSHECDHPPAVRDVPTVTESRIDADGDSDAIDRAVREAAADGPFRIHTDRLRAIDPDLVVTQAVCDHCAVDRALVERALADLAVDPAVLTTDPGTLSDVLDDVERVGAAVGAAERAKEFRADLEERIDAVERAVRGVPDRPRVAVLDWLDPVMAAGHWVPGMVERAGGEYGLVEAGDPSRYCDWAAVRAFDPAVLVLAPCGFPVERTRSHLAEVTDRPGWDDLTAVREGRVYPFDGDGYLHRPGPRLVDAQEFLAEIVSPGRFERGGSSEVRQTPYVQLRTPRDGGDPGASGQ